MKKNRALLCCGLLAGGVSVFGLCTTLNLSNIYAAQVHQDIAKKREINKSLKNDNKKATSIQKEQNSTNAHKKLHESNRVLSSKNGSRVHIDAEISKIRNDIAKDELDEGAKIKDLLISPLAPSKAHQPVYVVTPGTKLILGGSFDVQYGGISQLDDFKNMGDTGADMNCSSTRCNAPQNGLVENAKLKVLMSKIEEEIEYGLYYKLNVSPGKSADGYPGNDIAFAYLQNKYGRFEAGSNLGANSLMKIDAVSISAGSGGMDGDQPDWIFNRGAYYSTTNVTNKPNISSLFSMYPLMPYENVMQKKANKLTYLSPIIQGFSAGFSFVPDAQVRGTTKTIRKVYSGLEYKNIVEGIVKYSYNTDSHDKVGFEMSLGGEFGQSLPYLYTNTTNISQTEDTHPLRAYQIGGKIKYNAFSIVGSIGDAGKSGMLSKRNLTNDMKKQQKFFTTGIAYNNGKLGLSATYIHSNSAGLIANSSTSDPTDGARNTFVGYCSANGPCNVESVKNNTKTHRYSGLVFGAQYLIMPGLLPYLEVTKFKFSSPFESVKTNNGTAYMIGTKVSF